MLSYSGIWWHNFSNPDTKMFECWTIFLSLSTCNFIAMELNTSVYLLISQCIKSFLCKIAQFTTMKSIMIIFSQKRFENKHLIWHHVATIQNQRHFKHLMWNKPNKFEFLFTHEQIHTLTHSTHTSFITCQ